MPSPRPSPDVQLWQTALAWGLLADRGRRATARGQLDEALLVTITARLQGGPTKP